MSVIVRDDGFHAEDFTGTVVEIAADTAPATLGALIAAAEASAGEAALLLRVAFPAFSDGRGFTLARRARAAGYTGRLRAAGHVLADQYTMARRSGFDEVEISAELAARQDAAQWAARADWRAGDYRARLRG